MKILSSQSRINQLLREFSKQVELHNLSDRYDINRVSENIMCPLLRLIFGYEDIRNLNFTDWRNYPGIDLADSKMRIAFQITSTSNNDKVIETLEKIARNHLYRSYDRFVVYVLREKASRYSSKKYRDIIQGKFKFDPKKDIWDYRDLAQAVANLDDTAQVKRIERFLEDTFGKGQPFAWKKRPQKTEQLLLNVIGVTPSAPLYQADLAIDKKEVINHMRSLGRRLRYPVPDRTLVIEYLKKKDYRFPFDFICYENKLITFHDLYDEEHPLRSAIDLGTITPIPPRRFYNIDSMVDENRERAFKDLLRRCFVRMLKPHGVDWQEDERLFIFTMDDNVNNNIVFNEESNRYERRVEWVRERFVCLKKMHSQKPEQVLYYQHLAFSGRFYRIEDDWYLQVNPDWFFSYDGYRKNDYLNYYLKWLKREEVNNDVRNDFRFILHFLKDRLVHLFDSSFLKFKDEAKLFSGAPPLDDLLWNPQVGKKVTSSEEETGEAGRGEAKNDSEPTMFDILAAEE